MLRCRPKVHDVVNLYEYHDEENDATASDTNDDVDNSNNKSSCNDTTMIRNRPRKAAGVVFEQESSQQRIVVRPDDDNHPSTAATSKEQHNGSTTKQKASFLRTRVLSQQPQSKQQQQHQSSPTSVKDISSMYYNDQTGSEHWTNRTGGAITAVGRVTEMIVLDDYVSSAEEEDTTNNNSNKNYNSNNKTEEKNSNNKSFVSRMRQRRSIMNDDNNENNRNDSGNNKRNDDTMLWYQYLQTSDWERWYDSLVKCKHQKRCIRPDMILIPSAPVSATPAATTVTTATSTTTTTTAATRTVLHDAVWKAPTSLTLLLLDVLTTCPTTPILDEDEDENNGSKDDGEGGVSTPSSLSKMKQKMMIRKKRMIQRYLLCGDEVGNTPLHLACANLDRTIITTTTQTTTSNSTVATASTPITTTTTSGNKKSNKINNANKSSNNNNNEDATTATLTTTTTTTTTIDFSVIKNLLLLGPEALCMQNHVGDTPLHLLLSSNAYQQPRYQKSTERDSSSDSIAFANTVPKAVESVMAFLSMSKELAIIQNKNGLTPLHVAIANHCPKSVLQLLLSVEPRAATLLDKDGMNVLHYIAAFGAVSWTFVEQLLSIHPEFIHQQTIHGDTPLHLLIANTSIAYFPGMKNDFTKAFTYHDSRHTMKLLMILLGNANDHTLDDSSTADSKALTKIKPTILIQNAHGDTPLHFCARMNSPTLLTQTLMQSSFAIHAATIEAATDMTPLRIAMSTLFRVGDSHDAVGLRNAMGNVVALATLESCVLFDSNHLSPLMHAVQSKKWSAVLVKIILQVHSDTAKQVTPDGLIPLHYACQNSKIKTSTLKELLKAYPSGIKCVTKERDTPLHYAAIAGVESVLDFLIRKHPKAVQQRNVHGEWPIDLAIKFGIDPNVLDCFDISRLSPNIEKQ